MLRVRIALVTVAVACGACKLDVQGASLAVDTSNAFDTGISDSFAIDGVDEATDVSLDGDETANVGDSDARDVRPDVVVDTTPTCTETPSTTYGGHCYFLITNTGLVTWDAAKAQCESSTPPAHIATFESPGEHVVGDALCTPAHHCFVGFVSLSASKRTVDFHWYDGATGWDGAWCGGYPASHGACGSWWKDATLPGCFQDLDCVKDPHQRVICERD